jgi:hypothetical protein
MSKFVREIIGRGTQIIIGVGLSIACVWLSTKAYDYSMAPPSTGPQEPPTADGLRAFLLAACALLMGLIALLLLIGAIAPASFWDRFVRPPQTGENVEPRRRAGWRLWYSLFRD